MDGNINNPGSVNVADQAFGVGVTAQQPGPGPLPVPPQSAAPPSPPAPPIPYSPTVVSETSFGQAPSPGNPLDDTVSRGSHSHGTPSDANLAKKLAQVVVVAKAGGDFTSVAAAVAFVTGLADAAHPYAVDVASGSYVEPPFTIPPFVAVQGNGLVFLIPANNSSDFISGASSAILNYASVVCPSGAGTSGIRSLGGVGDFYVYNVFLIGQGRYGIRATTGGSIAANTVLYGGGVFDQFVRSDGGGQIILTNSAFRAPNPASTGYGFVCTGPGSTFRISNCLFDNQGSNGAMVDDDGILTFQGMQFVSGAVAIHVGNNGVPRMFARATTIQEDASGSFTTTIQIDTAAARVSFEGAMSRNKFILAPGAVLDADFADLTTGDGGSTTLGTSYTARADNPNVVFPESQYNTDTDWTGLRGTGNGGVTKVGGLVLHVAANYGYYNNGVDKIRVDWLAQNITLDPNTTEYVYVDPNGIVQKTVSRPVYALTIVLAQAVTNATDVVLLTRDEITISQVLSRTQEYFEDVIGPINIGGGLASVNVGDPLALDVEPGSFSVGISERNILGGTGVTFTYWYNTPGGWVSVPGQTHVDTTQYNDISTGLVPMTGTNWKKDLLYVVVNAGGDEYHVVYGQEQFASQVSAEQGNYPAPPFILQHYGMRSSGVVSLKGASAVGSITDALPRLGGFITTSGVTNHGALTGLGNDDHLQYLTTGRAATWHFSTPVSGEAHVKNGNLHTHGAGGDGGQVNHFTLSNIGLNTHVQIDAHIANLSNPHATTAAQVGAPPTSRLVTAGNGLSGGGNLSADITLTVLAADSSITVAAGGIAVNTVVIVPSTRMITAGNGLTGGGDLTANRTLTVLASDTSITVAGGGVSVNTAVIVPSTRLVNGHSLAADVTLTASDVGADPSGAAATVQTNLNTHAALTTTAHGGIVPSTRTITAGNGLTGGGDLTSNRTLTVLATDTSITVAVGGISVNTTVITPTSRTITAGNGLAGGGDLTANRTLSVLASDTSITVAVGGISVNTTVIVPSTRTITAGNGLMGGGDLSTNRTLTVAASDSSITVAAGGISVNTAVIVPSVRTVTAGNGLTGGGDLSANRTFTVQASDSTITVGAGGVAVGTITDTNVAAGNKDGTAGTPSMRTLGTGAQQACAGNDARLSDARVDPNYQQVSDPTRTTLTGAGSTSYPPAGGATKLTMTTPALTGTFRISWSAVIDYISFTSAQMNIRVQNTTNAVTLNEVVFSPSLVNRSTFSGQATVTFTGSAKTFAMQFHNQNTVDTSGVEFAYMDFWKVG